MGNLDRWRTPKQIKIERAGEPRPLRRGALKKGERRKGKKARIDEVLSAMREAKRYAEYIVSDRKRRKEHPEWFRSTDGRSRVYDPEYEKWFDKAALKLLDRIQQAVKDGIILPSEGFDYYVQKP